MSMDDRQLLIRTRRGEEHAARVLWATFAPRMLAYARGILGRRYAHGADDVVQSVFLSVLTISPRRLRRVEDVSAWLLALTRNSALNHLRTIRRERARIGVAAPARARPDTAEPDDRLAAAVDTLPRRYREPLILKHIAGLTFDQLALALDINRNTAASRYRTALDMLRRAMSSDADVQPTGDRHV
jgi:RNA polymerase sigma-70 factor, ECF subfamily